MSEMSDVNQPDTWAEHMAIAARHPRRVEIVVGLSFFLAILSVFALGWIFTQKGQPQIEGMMLFVLFGGIGFGMAAWGKYLMPKGPFAEEREVLTSEENQERFSETFQRGRVAVEGRRSFLAKMFVTATGLMGAILLFPLRSLTDKGPQADGPLYKTQWKPGVLLVDETNQPVHIGTLDVGGSLTVFPHGYTDAADDQTLLIRAATTPVAPPDRPDLEKWSPAGYLAFSKVCTHAGCPVGQYEAQYQKLLCPCHESTFDVLDGAAVVFGPAPRPLPQLPLMQDDNGYLRARGGYGEPIGPGFWSRGG
ncbi:MAG TPA: Rieske 2Fe-2S domain-containing protein [Acidimicrobiales bacterium]|nr:Rieske 2Fe-2S domain-containing protein [Acidimicrobiales bacterium]